MTRSRLISTSDGTRSEAFAGLEWGLLALIAGIWGSSFLFIELALESFSPFLITSLRIGFGATALALVPGARRPIERYDWPRVFLVGIVWMAFPLSLFPIAQQWIDSSLAGMLNSSMPLFSAFFAALLLRRSPGRPQFVGLVLGFAGVAVITLPAVDNATSSSGLGALLVIAATASYGLAANLVVPLQQRYGSLPVLLRVQVVALIATAPMGMAGVADSSFSPTALAATVALGALGTGVAFVLMASLVGRVGATRGSVAIYFIPLVAIVLGVVFLDESVAALSVIGTAVVLLGAWLTSRSERSK
ncbi:MAG: DMT family transporter [Acidimicrobiia bacterium]|nr:DMT family transporter [Acidimicrobiia bacterium]